MTQLNLWLDSPGNPSKRLTIEDSFLVYRLKSDLSALSDLPQNGQDGRFIEYEIVCLRSGVVLEDNTAAISSLARDGDHFILRSKSAESSFVSESPPKPKGAGRVSITGISPFSLDFQTEYPVLAVRVRYAHSGDTGVRTASRRPSTNDLFSNRKPIYAKDSFFLTTDTDGKFEWVSSSKSSYYVPELSKNYPVREHQRLTRYSIDKDFGELKNMIYPVRQFSITGISMEGFDPNKEYPVLAIDMDQYMPENPSQEEPDGEEKQPQSQSMAFFLVGDDNGEFAWIAEDECRLYPLKA